MGKYPFRYEAGPENSKEQFLGKYKIVGHGGAQYCNGDDLEEVRESIVTKCKHATLDILVYAHPEGSAEEDNTGRYIVSSHATAVALEIRNRLS